MSLYQRSRSILFKEFIERNYQGVSDQKKQSLLAIQSENLLSNEVEFRLLLTLIRVTNLILNKPISKTGFLSESIYQLGSALQAEFLHLYVFNRRKKRLEEKISYGVNHNKWPSILLEEWDLLYLRNEEEISSTKHHKKEVISEHRDLLEIMHKGKKKVIGAVVWKKTLSVQAQPVVKDFLREMCLFCMHHKTR